MGTMYEGSNLYQNSKPDRLYHNYTFYKWGILITKEEFCKRGFLKAKKALP